MKTGDPYFLERISDKKVFWQFHTCIKKWLHEYAKKSDRDTTTYPWNYYSIEFGDYERVYNQVLHTNHGLFIDAFGEEKHKI